jgi:hypothetical protein
MSLHKHLKTYKKVIYFTGKETRGLWEETGSHILPNVAPKINELTPWRRVLFEKPTVTQLVKKFPAFYGTWRFITVFTTARHWSLSWDKCVHPISLRSILILSSHPYDTETKILYALNILIFTKAPASRFGCKEAVSNFSLAFLNCMSYYYPLSCRPLVCFQSPLEVHIRKCSKCLRLCTEMVTICTTFLAFSNFHLAHTVY